MAELLNLTAPINQNITTSTWKVVFLQMDMESSRIIIRVKSNLDVYKEILYEGQIAIDYMKALNLMNFSTNSMQKRILQRLSTDGVLVGAVSGVPD